MKQCFDTAVHTNHLWDFKDNGGSSTTCWQCAGVPSRTQDRIAEAADPSAIHRSAGTNQEYAFRFDLVDGPAMYEMAHVLYLGEKKYGKDNWRRYEVENHLNHIMAHCLAYLAGNRDDTHLANIMCNAMFAQAKECRPDYLGEATQ